ncbi:two-partner secretion domain-containing protein [Leptothoe kymatousa]|uniref:Filamentous hemagglutinin N-terminal domain-containing protein n=1 Tax=Leptothoe kymatousa TAU-MAC 1615 TaxID=2364775 RepID=A0ABS5Y762_9CYAN|nr:filamentous hemagglutinin N-terminal domain-containing protein [Leptothoe kymatousa]MBT9313668.1 filamentous hemagglutinin N-terminal domain-containing protein [Leptothoe kymatousa TAU-MAC 1615]
MVLFSCYLQVKKSQLFQIVGLFSLMFGGIPSSVNALPIVPDTSLGSESSILTPENRNSRSVEGGAIRGGNLFHSFAEFNINLGQQIEFSSDSTVESIFTRVTGVNDSQILGALRVSGDANFFLINPNGIFFGPDAELKLDGSFLATTADSVAFGDYFNFNTMSQNVPPETLLTIQPSALIYSRPSSGSIVSEARLRVDNGEQLQLVGGTVDIKKNTDARLNSLIRAREGLIELGGVSEPGQVGLSADGNLLFSQNVNRAAISISNTEVDARLDNRLNGDSSITQGGDINLYGDTISLDGIKLFSGFRERRGTSSSQAGDITFDATGDIIMIRSLIENNLSKFSVGVSGQISLIASGDIHLDRTRITSELSGTGGSRNILVRAGGDLVLDTSKILNTVNRRGNGDAGNIDIQAVSLYMETDDGTRKSEQSQISTGTEGQGNGGDISIAVDRINMIGPGISGSSGITANSSEQDTSGNAGSIVITVDGPIFMTQRGKIESAIQRRAIGNGGNIEINAQSLTLEETSFIQAQSRSGADGLPGNITLNLEGGDLEVLSESFITASISSNNAESSGNSENYGNITIIADDILLGNRGELENRSFIEVSTFGSVDAGRIDVTANSIDIDHIYVFEETSTESSGFFSRSRPNAEGDGGEIIIDTKSLRLAGNSVINAVTEGRSSGGDLDITADRIELVGGGQIIASTFGEGDAGNVTINTFEQILISGEDPSYALQVEKAERLVTEDTDILDLRQVINRESPRGLITTENPAPSGIFVSSQPVELSGADDSLSGNAGELSISTDILLIEDGGQISANTFGSGNGLTSEINVRRLYIQDGGTVGAGSLLIPQGSLLAPNIEASQLGAGGNLIINAVEKIEISDTGSRLFTSAEGNGAAGNIRINETVDGNLIVVVRDKAEISARTESSTGGNIEFNNPDAVLLRNGGRINVESGASQSTVRSGNINLNMPDGFVITVPEEDSDIIARAVTGNGGNINITAQGIFNLVERPAVDGNGTNDIDASSQFGQSGTVLINDPELDPTDDLTELPVDTTAPTVAQRCLADSQGQSAFVVTGQGGTSPSPGDIVRNESAGLVDLGNTIVGNSPAPSTVSNAAPEPSEPIVEAQGWQRNETGNVVLTAPPNHAYASAQYTAVCSVVRR